MGKSHSKENFTQWDLDRFSNVTGIPRAQVEQLYQEFIATTGKDNRMDKKEFRRLYKALYTSGQTGTSVPAVISEHDLEKISDRVFKAFDADGSGKLTFEEFVNAYLLINQNQTSNNSAITPRDRLAYVLDHNSQTPGYVTREQGEQVLNRLNRFYNWEDTTKTTSTTTTPAGSKKPVTKTWEQHWTRLDDGSGRVPQEKFVEYVTTSDDYKNHLNRPLQ
jgi:Ca2+-binding EF-hand superfamily protein